MDKRAAWVLGILFGGLFLCLFGFLMVLFLAVKGGTQKARFGRGEGVGVVEVVGEIQDPKKILEALDDFEEDRRVKAVVVRIDSPGGAVGPSQEIFEALNDLKAKKKVVVSMGSLAASGGFYIACAGDKVFANPGTLTGSIGVIMQLPNLEGLLRWAKVEMRSITSGKMKDAGSPFRPMTEDERTYFEGVLVDVHQQFVEAVARGRQLTPEEVKPFADGRVFTGRQAKEWKLVDELGGFNDAVAAAGQLGGIEGKPELIYPPEEGGFLREVLSEVSSGVGEVTARALRSAGTPGLWYRIPAVQ